MNRLAIPAFALLTGLLLACGNKTDEASAQQQVALGEAAVAYKPTVQRLYIAYFGRPADVDGLGSFQRQLAAINAPTDIQELTLAYDTSPALKNLVDSFSTSPESAALYSGDNTQFVTSIYQNILGRKPQAGGLAFWLKAIDTGAMTRANASLAIMAGALANATPAGLEDAKLINNRLAAASAFTDAVISAKSSAYSGKAAAASARAMLGTITASTDQAAYQGSVATLVKQLPAP